MRFRLRPWHVIVLTPLLLIGAVWFYYWWISTALRLRLTVTVDDNGIERVGSGVIEMEYRMQLKILPEEIRYNAVFHYEAPMVDLKEKGYLFALPNIHVIGKGSFSIPGALIDYIQAYKLVPDSDSEKVTVNALRRLGPKTKVYLFPYDKSGDSSQLAAKPPYPAFACFKNPQDFRTLIVPDSDNIAQCFGPGVTIKSVSMEVTDDPLTNNHIERIIDLSWPPGRTFSYGMPNPVDFKKGLPND